MWLPTYGRLFIFRLANDTTRAQRPFASHGTVTDTAFVLLDPENADRTTADRWVALRTRPRAEKMVAWVLERRGVEHCLPLITVKRRWSDRWKEVELPVFPGYLFAQCSASAWPQVLTIGGVLSVVKRGRQPAWVKQTEIDELKAALEMMRLHGSDGEVVSEFIAGERVRVISGPFSGLSGVVRENRGRRRLLIGFEQIGQALCVSIEKADIQRSDD